MFAPDKTGPNENHDSVVGLTNDNVRHYQALETDNTAAPKYYTICQYTDCTSPTGDKCQFPFRYKNRMYDTCITIDKKGPTPGEPWCSSKRDEFNNHIEGNEISCSDSCRVVDCPIGFYWMHRAGTCWQVRSF